MCVSQEGEHYAFNKIWISWVWMISETGRRPLADFC